MVEETPSSSNITFNPFEAESLDSLHLPTFSPSVFSTKLGTPSNVKKQKPGEFRWSIDQLASLYPADIDENVEQVEAPLDHEMEAKVQSTISRFFEEKLHVPSPWSAPCQAGKAQFKSPAVASSQKLNHSESPCVQSKNLPNPSSHGVDAICQTAITLPVNFDLAGLLGDKCQLYSETEEDESPLSTSLRRKLFSHCSDSPSLNTPGSTSKAGLRTGTPASDQALPSPNLSPVQQPEEGDEDDEHQGVSSKPKTPNSAGSQFSSSPLVLNPVQRVCTPFTPRGPSPHMKSLGTPLLSPICKDSETPRTGKADKRNQVSSFASKLSFSSDLASSSPIPIHSEVSLSHGQMKSSPVKVPDIDEDHSCCSMEVIATVTDKQFCGSSPTSSTERFYSGQDKETRPCSSTDLTRCLFADGDGNYENDKLTSTQLVEGNSGNNLTFDLTMNDGDLTAMEISSVHITTNLGIPVSTHQPIIKGHSVIQERSGTEQRCPDRDKAVSAGVDNIQSELTKNTQRRVDSGYSTHSLPTVNSVRPSLSTLPAVTTSSIDSLPVLTLSSSGSLSSLNL